MADSEYEVDYAGQHLSTKSPFVADPEFCCDCGAILPMPNADLPYVECVVCKLRVDVKEFDGIEIRSEIVFSENRDRYLAAAASKTKEKTTNAADGPLVDRRCPKCENEGMTYATLQTRSADEGQTVFYTCPKCRFKEIENS